MGKVAKHERFRYQRHITIRDVIVPYDDRYSKVDRILFKVKGGRYEAQHAKYFDEFRVYDKKSRASKHVYYLIVTEKYLLFSSNEKTLKSALDLKTIDNVRVYEGGEDRDSTRTIYNLSVYTSKKRYFIFQTTDYDVINRAYNRLNR